MDLSGRENVASSTGIGSEVKIHPNAVLDARGGTDAPYYRQAGPPSDAALGAIPFHFQR